MNEKMIGNRIRQMRRARGLTQEQLAETLGISDRYIRDLEKGRRMGSVDLLTDFADFFGVSLDYLVLGKNCATDSLKDKIREMVDFLSSVEKSL